MLLGRQNNMLEVVEVAEAEAEVEVQVKERALCPHFLGRCTLSLLKGSLALWRFLNRRLRLRRSQLRYEVL